jgi:hypothetical protein
MCANGHDLGSPFPIAPVLLEGAIGDIGPQLSPGILNGRAPGQMFRPNRFDAALDVDRDRSRNSSPLIDVDRDAGLLAEPHISVVDGPAFSVSVGAAAAGERGHCPWFRKPACRANHRSRGSGREPGPAYG